MEGPPRKIDSLRQHCVLTLIRYRDCLGDLGYIDPQSVVDILSHCNEEQLAEIEDSTREGSQRELCWYTWHLWHKIFITTFSIDTAETIELHSFGEEAPVDYVPPACKARVGDWRRALYQYRAELAEREARVRGRLRGLYQAEKEAKDSRKAEVCTRLAPPKRRRMDLGARPQPPSNVKASTFNLMRTIGMLKPGAKPPGLGTKPTGTRLLHKPIPQRTTVSYGQPRPGGAGGPQPVGRSSGGSGNGSVTSSISRPVSSMSGGGTGGARPGAGTSPAKPLGGGSSSSGGGSTPSWLLPPKRAPGAAGAPGGGSSGRGMGASATASPASQAQRPAAGNGSRPSAPSATARAGDSIGGGSSRPAGSAASHQQQQQGEQGPSGSAKAALGQEQQRGLKRKADAAPAPQQPGQGQKRMVKMLQNLDFGL